MSYRDEIIVIQAKTNSIKVDIEQSVDEDKTVYVLDISIRLDDVLDDMQRLIEEMEVN